MIILDVDLCRVTLKLKTKTYCQESGEPIVLKSKLGSTFIWAEYSWPIIQTEILAGSVGSVNVPAAQQAGYRKQ